MKSNCRYGENDSFWKNFFPSREKYFTLSSRLWMGVEFAEFADGSGSQVVGAIRHLSHESIRSGEKALGGSSYERERLNG